MAWLVILLCVFNLVMWLLAIVRFRKMFSTDDIVEKTRNELNNMMMEINRNAERNVTLLEDRIQKLKEVSAEADHHIEILRGEILSIEKSKTFQSKLIAAESKQPSLDFASGLESPKTDVESLSASIERKRRSSSVKSTAKSSTKVAQRDVKNDVPLFEEENTVETQKPVVRNRPRGPLAAYQYEQKNMSKSLSSSSKAVSSEKDNFSQELDAIVRKSSFEIEMNGNPEPAVKTSTKKRPSAPEPEIIVAQNLIQPKKSKKDQVLDLAATGLSVDEIAQQLKTTTTEVEFILDMA